MQQAPFGYYPSSFFIIPAILSLLFIIAIIIITYRLAKEKGKNVVLWTILSIIPIVNIFVLNYIIGTPSNLHNEKMDKILELLNQMNQK